MTQRRWPAVAVGVTVIGALLLAAVALVMALRAPVAPDTTALVDALVAAGAVAWCLVSWGVARLVVEVLRHGVAAAPVGPLGWAAVHIAALVLVVAPFLEPSSGAAPVHRGGLAASPTRPAAAAVVVPAIPRDDEAGTWAPEPPHRATAQRAAEPQHRAPRHLRHGAHRGHGVSPSGPAVGHGTALIALAAAVRRRTRRDGRVMVDDEAARDTETCLLGATDSQADLLGAAARSLAACGLLARVAHVVLDGGEVEMDGGGWTFDPLGEQVAARCLAVVLGELNGRTHVALVPRGTTLGLGGARAASLLDDAVRVSGALDLGHVVCADADGLLRALAVRGDDDLVVCVNDGVAVEDALAARCVVVEMASATPFALVHANQVRLADDRTLVRSELSAAVRELLDGDADRAYDTTVDTAVADPGPLDASGSASADAYGLDEDAVVVRLLTAVPRVDGLAVPLEAGRERRAVELVAYLALHAGEPVTGERLRVRVLGSTTADAASKTLFNVASTLRRALGDGPYGPRLPPAGQFGHYGVAPDVVCDVAMLVARVAAARRCGVVEERMAWLRAALDLIESEPFATVLSGYDWFLAEGHLTRLQVLCEDAACELVELALDRGLVALAVHALDRARLVDPYAERLAEAAARIAGVRQASLAAIAPAARSTVPSAPAVT